MRFILLISILGALVGCATNPNAQPIDWSKLQGLNDAWNPPAQKQTNCVTTNYYGTLTTTCQ